MAYGTTKVDTIQSSTAGTPPQFKDGNGTQIGTLCRAWVNLNLSAGSSNIRASFNISSVTYNSTGNATLNFTTAFSDANYILTTSSGNTGSTATTGFTGAYLSSTTAYSNKTTSACAVLLLSGNNSALLNQFDINIAIFR